MSQITSEEVNYLIFRYLQEAGFVHSAFLFGQESLLTTHHGRQYMDVKHAAVAPGALICLLQKGLQFTSIEHHLNEDGSEKECSRPFTLLEPHVCDVVSEEPQKEMKDSFKRSELTETTTTVTAAKRKEKEPSKDSGGGKKRKKEKAPVSTTKHKEKIEDSSIATTATTAIDVVGGEEIVVAEPKTRQAGAKSTSSSNPHALIPPFTAEQVHLLSGHRSEVISCAWNPRFPAVASASGDMTARIWWIAATAETFKIDIDGDEKVNGSSVLILEHGSKGADVTCLDWSPDGQRLVTGCYDGQARLWSLKGQLLGLLAHHTGPIFGIRWSPDGRYIASVGLDQTAQVWDLTGNNEQTTVVGSLHRIYSGHASAPTLDVDWRADGRYFAVCSTDRAVYVYGLDGSEPQCILSAAHEDEVNSVRWSPDGSMLASCSDDRTAKIWRIFDEKTIDEQSIDAKDAKDEQSIDAKDEQSIDEQSAKDAIDEQSKDDQKSIRASLLHTLVGHSSEIYTIKWAPLGNTADHLNRPILATASFDHTVRLWDPSVDTKGSQCVHLLSLHTQPVYAIGFSPDGRYLASGSLDETLAVWDVSTGKAIRSFSRGTEDASGGGGGIFEVAWSPDGQRLVACTSTLALRMGEYDRAKTAFETVLGASSNNAQALVMLGHCYHNQHDYSTAIDYYQKALQVQPNRPDAWAALGHCWLVSEDLGRAFGAYQQCLHSPALARDPTVWFGIGILYDRYAAAQLASEAFTAALRLVKEAATEGKESSDGIASPLTREIYFRLGVLFRTRGLYGPAGECLRYVMAFPPPPLTSAHVRVELALLAEARGDGKEALELLKPILTSGHAERRVRVLSIWLGAGPEERKDCFAHSSVDRDEEVKDRCEIDNPLLKAAITGLEELLAESSPAAEDASDDLAWYYLGRLAVRGRLYSRAYEAYQQAVYKDSQNAAIWNSIGVLYYRIKQYRDALDAFSRAIHQSPFTWEIWWNLGVLYESCNSHQLSDAIDAFVRAAELADHKGPIEERIGLLKRISTASPPSLSEPEGSPSVIELNPVSFTPRPVLLHGDKALKHDQRL